MWPGKQSHAKQCSSGRPNNSILNANKLQQLFSSRRSSSFTPSFDYFDSAQAFIPSKMALALQKDKKYQKADFNQKSSRSSRLQVLHVSSSLSKRQRQAIQTCEYSTSLRRGTVSYLKAKPIVLGNRNYVKNLVLKRGSQRLTETSHMQNYVNQNSKSQRAKNIKVGVGRLKQSRFWGRTEMGEEPITGWNYQYTCNQSQTYLL